jgi:hypothetical protein
MKSTVYRYGLLSMLALVVFSAIQLFALKNTSFEVQEASGYLAILVSMIFVFLGIRHYRDRVNSGYMTFGQGLKIGLLIVLIPSVAFGLFDILYTEVINPGWSEEYYSHYVEKVKASTSPEKLDAVLKQVQSQKELFSSPIMQFLIMAATVFIIGLIVAIISSLSLMKKKKLATA